MVGIGSGGFLVQFTPELLEKKRIDPPPGPPLKITDVFWHSTTLFLASFVTPEDEQPHVFSILCAKNEPVNYTDFQDICYGACEERQAKYFFRGIADWDLVSALSETITNQLDTQTYNFSTNTNAHTDIHTRTDSRTQTNTNRRAHNYSKSISFHTSTTIRFYARPITRWKRP